jgi:PIN domain nuclease of toxin-antitoxin system
VTYVLDACALIAMFNIEPGAKIIRDMLVQATAGEIKVFLNPVNLTEVYYDRIKIAGIEQAKEIRD